MASINNKPALQLNRHAGSKKMVELELVKGLEPSTYGLQNHCSAVELHQRNILMIHP